jgi:hypothetical protein
VTLAKQIARLSKYFDAIIVLMYVPVSGLTDPQVGWFCNLMRGSGKFAGLLPGI